MVSLVPELVIENNNIMGPNKYSDLVKKLENEELDQTNVESELYIQLLAAYMYQSEFLQARFLWKRIPKAMKDENEELERLRVLLYALDTMNFREFFKNINYNWSENIKCIIDDVLERTREYVFTLVGHTYSTIFENDLMQLTQLSRDQLKEACLAMGWEYEPADGQQTIISPKRVVGSLNDCANSEDQLFKLTEFVSFLEN